MDVETTCICTYVIKSKTAQFKKKSIKSINLDFRQAISIVSWAVSISDTWKYTNIRLLLRSHLATTVKKIGVHRINADDTH